MTSENCCGKLGQKFRGINWKNVALRLFPVATWLPKYNVKRDLRYDIIAGLTVGLTAVPQSLAYAQVGNVAPQYGLYSCFIGMIIYFFMGTSKDASIGPSALVSMLSGQITASVMPSYMVEAGDPTCSTILAFMAGLVLMVMGIAKLGFLVSLFSVPVVSGFTSASGFAIAASQIATLVGLKSTYQRPPGVFVRQIKFFFEHLADIKPHDAILGFSSIAFLFVMQFLPRITEKSASRVRNPKVAPSLGYAIFMEMIYMASAARNVILFAVAIPMAYFLNSNKRTPVFTMVGKIPAGFPTMKVPKFYLTNKTSGVMISDPWRDPYLLSHKEPAVLKPALDLMEELGAGIVIVALMASLELFAITKALGRKNGYRVNASQELLTIGLANFLQGFVTGVPVTAAVTRCALNDLCRVKTQLSSLISAAVVMIVIGTLTEITLYVPKAALAAIIIAAAVNLIEFSILKILWKTHRQDFGIFIVTFLLCLFYDIAYGIIICLLINLLTFLRPLVQMKMFVDIKPIFGREGAVDKRIAVVRLPFGMKYPSADKFSDRITAILKTISEKYVLIDCQFISGLDYTGYQAFCGLLLAAIKFDKHVMFANVSENLSGKMKKMGIGDNFRLAATVEDAIAKFVSPEDSPSSKLTPTGSIDKISAFQGDKHNQELIHQLSVEPRFYADIPISVGHFHLNSVSEGNVNDSADLTSLIIQQQSDYDTEQQQGSPAKPESRRNSPPTLESVAEQPLDEPSLTEAPSSGKTSPEQMKAEQPLEPSSKEPYQRRQAPQQRRHQQQQPTIPPATRIQTVSGQVTHSVAAPSAPNAPVISRRETDL